MSYINKKEFDICAVCKNNNTEECSSCEIRHAYTNNFQPDGRKVIINNKLQLYAHFVKCTKKCGEIENGKCGAGRFEHERCKPVKVLVPLPEDGKCLFPNFFPYFGLEGLETEGLEENEMDNGIIDDIPF
ncbi:MAG: hypothetical protein LBH43_21020 [Treponema sp.]|jgi:hypothetical protein|nr:hypothetical protein [Treponema sp.]